MVNKIKTTFSDDFLSQIRGLLLTKKEEVSGELGVFTNRNSNVNNDYDAQFPEYGDEEDDNAREVAEYTSNKPLELALEKELIDIDKSLKRLDESAYGICKYCDQPIDEKRLLARPTSSSCVSCKKALTNEV